MKSETSTIPEEIIERSIAGRISRDDALLLTGSIPLEVLGLADRLRSTSSGNEVSYIINRNINFTDHCSGSCRFCAFKDSTGYVMSLDQILEKVERAVQSGSSEVCIQGGLMENIDPGFYTEMLEAIRSRFPSIHIHAFSPMEVYHAASVGGMSVKQTLLALKKSGLDTMPGTAAEILSDRVRETVCPEKITTREWIDIITTAHNTGIRTTSTMMYGHVETIEERIDHIMTIRDIQDRTGGFSEFVPLPFMPYNNSLGEEMMRSGRYMVTGTEDLMIHALARIILHGHLNNIQASWVKLGKKAAQFALHCGANDLGGTLMEERISKSAGAESGEYMSAEEFEWMIRSAGRTPVRRNTLYERI